MKRRIFLACVLFVGLSACGTSPPVHFYALSEPAPSPIAKTGDTVVIIGPLDVAQYLKRPNIIVRDADHRLKVAQFDQWAEAPQLAIVPWLAREVDRQLAQAVVMAFPPLGHADAPYHVRGTIAEWDTDASGAAVLVVQWECASDNGPALVPVHTSRYTAQAAKPDDYSDIVRALNQTLTEFAADIAGALSSALPPPRS